MHGVILTLSLWSIPHYPTLNYFENLFQIDPFGFDIQCPIVDTLHIQNNTTTSETKDNAAHHPQNARRSRRPQGMGRTRFLIGSTRRRDNPTLTLRRIPWILCSTSAWHLQLQSSLPRHGSHSSGKVGDSRIDSG